MLQSATLHAVRQRLQSQERRLLARLRQGRQEAVTRMAEGRAAATAGMQRALARRIKRLHLESRLTTRRIGLVRQQTALVETLLALKNQTGAGARFRAEGLLTRFDWPALLADVERVALAEQGRLEQLAHVVRALSALLPPPVMAAVPARPADPAPTQARVAQVVDGDTLRLENGEYVRYIGIDTPEMAGLDGWPEPFAEAATRRNAELVAGREVRLVRDVSERDRFGRLLRYVYCDDHLINATLVREGLAVAFTLPPDISLAHRFEKAEQEARLAGRGLWAA